MNTHSITYLKTDADGASAWRVKGSAWSTLACPWLITHDLFHHSPGDQGTMMEELATIGAEFYVNYERPGMLDLSHDNHHSGSAYAHALKSLSSSACAIVGMPFEEGIAAPESFILPLDDGETRLAPTLEHLLTRCARSAVESLDEHVLDDADWAHAKTRFSSAAVAAVMRMGYLRARNRFPDREAVMRAFDAAMAQIAIHSAAPVGTELTVTRQGLTISITEVLPA